MNVRYATEGFIFKQENSLGADRIFSIFTRDFGRVEVFGKAIREINSKLKSGAELFSVSRIEFIQGRNKKTLTDAVSLEKYKSLGKSPVKLEIAYRASDIINTFLKGQESDEKILKLMVDFFQKLDKNSLYNILQ